MGKKEYLDMIMLYILKKIKTIDEIVDFYDEIVLQAPYNEKDNVFRKFLLELDDLSEEFEYTEDINELKKYDVKLIKIMKKYNYLKDTK